ncbi:MAG TPA: fimbria/pilus outer membrane usher protein [Myxococcales bacterium]|nr:fimbria/pilus outer membrane usher protein [Myxococcales bacterium]
MRHELRTATLLLFCAWPALAGAQFSGGEAALGAVTGAEQRAFLDLIVNLESKGQALVVLRAGDALVSVADLEAAGIRGFGGKREAIDGREFVLLSSLAPSLTFAVDEKGLSLKLTAAPDLLQRTVVDLRSSGRPPGLVLRRDTSAFFNYSARLDTQGALQGFAELGASIKGDLLYSGATRLPDGTVVRGLSNYTIDQPEEMRRMVAGDAVQGGSLLGGAATIFGFTVQREYSLDPYFLRSPLPAAQGFATTPSTLEVYVNGQMVRREPIAPGGFDVLNMPLSTGDGTYQTIVRDAFGRATEVSSRYYYSTGVLGKGLHEYSYSAGLLRQDFGTASFSYSGPAFMGRHRYGFTDWLTAGGRFEATDGLASGGGTAVARLPLGELEADVAASGGSHFEGTAASLSYLYTSRHVSGGALIRWQSRSYATLSLRPTDDRALGQANLFLGAPLFSRLSLNAELQAAHMRDTGNQTQLQLRADVSLAQRATLSLSAARTLGQGPQTQLFCAFNWVFDAQTIGSVNAASNAGAGSAGASVQRTLGVGPGFGYVVNATQAEAGASGNGLLQAQGDHGYVEAEYQRFNGVNAGDATVSGGLVLIGGDFFASRPVQDGYALIQVPGIEGVRGMLNNQVVGRTDAKGNLLVPDIVPYFGNKLSVDPSDVPFDRLVDKTEQLVASPLRGGAVVQFAMPKINSVQGKVVLEGGEAPAYGELTVSTAQGERTSPVGAGGQFFLENLPPGRHRGQIEATQGTCTLELSVPDSAGSVDLGTLSCAQQVAAKP